MIKLLVITQQTNFHVHPTRFKNIFLRHFIKSYYRFIKANIWTGQKFTTAKKNEAISKAKASREKVAKFYVCANYSYMKKNAMKKYVKYCAHLRSYER